MGLVVLCLEHRVSPKSTQGLELKTERLKVMTRKRVSVTRESDTGRNQRFHDNYSGADLTRPQFVKQIEVGEYPNYHVRKVHGMKTPVSNPDRTKNNNLG